MDGKEGFRRINRIFSIIGWLWLTLFLAVCLSSFANDIYQAGFALSIGVFGIFLAQGAAWIIAGFSGLKKPEDGIIRLADMRRIFVRKKREPIPSSKPVVSGIGGWLFIFILSLLVTAIRFINSYFSTIQLFEEANLELPANTYFIALKIICWTAAISFLGAFWLMIRYRNSTTITTVVRVIWVCGLGALVADTAAAAIFLPTWKMQIDDIGQIIAAFISTTIWSLYLLRSERVRNTYRSY
jgi:hypothetical protein